MQRKEVLRLLKEQLFPQLDGLLLEAEFDRGGVRLDSATERLAGIFASLLAAYRQTFSPTRLELELTLISEDLSVFQGKEHQRQMGAALGLPVLTVGLGGESFLRALLKGFIADNVRLVKNLQEGQIESLETIVSGGIRKGLRVGDIQKEIQDKLRITKSRAALLARDQVGKLFGELAEHRQRDAGLTEYIWDTSKDERVRPFHRALEASTQKWSKPPVINNKGHKAHPGGDFQCRCQALPVIPEELLTAAA